MPKKKRVIATGAFRIEPGDYKMLYTEDTDPEEMEEKFEGLNGEEGTLIFVPKS